MAPIYGYDGGEVNGCLEAVGGADALSGNIGGGSMIDRGPDEWQSQGDVVAGCDVGGLEGGGCLSRVHGDHGIERAGPGFLENGVGRIGPADLRARIAALAGLFSGWHYHGLFFAAEQPVFTGMGIEAGDADTDRGKVQISSQRPLGEDNLAHDCFTVQVLCDLGE